MSNVTGVELNHDNILSKIEVGGREKLKKAALKKTREKARIAQAAMLDFFDRHEITKELQGDGIEKFSGVIDGNGNLFSFIGFKKGTDPTKKLRKVLAEPLEFTFMGILKRGKNASQFRYRIGIPHLGYSAEYLTDKIEDATPIPWSTGESWVEGIKNGISGIGQYISVPVTHPDNRSKQGVQNENANRPKSFVTQDYMGEVFKEFIKTLKTL